MTATNNHRTLATGPPDTDPEQWRYLRCVNCHDVLCEYDASPGRGTKVRGFCPKSGCRCYTVLDTKARRVRRVRVRVHAIVLS